MKSLSRRTFCSITTALGVTSLSGRLIAQAAPLAVSLSVDPTAKLAKMPDDFMGLSYESGQLVYPDFFSAENTALIEIFKRLSPAGVLRLGGNVSEFTAWSEMDQITPPSPGGLVGPDPGHLEPRTYTITPRSIRNLHGFLEATRWRCIYGLNLGGGTPEQAVAEAEYVATTLGSKLICAQFGNEPDLFRHRDQGNKPWSYDEFLLRWKTFRAAFREKLPNILVAGPDTAGNPHWVNQFTEDVPKDIVLVTSHYYPEGPPSDPRMNIDLLLHPGKHFDNACREALVSSKAADLSFRMSEGNSCYNAGKPGVSDTFASALWAGDFCLQLAAMGCVGVNFHGGANGFYSPIIGSTTSSFVVRPEFYGLMLAQQFAGHTLHPAKVEADGANLTAYAGSRKGAPNLVAIFNKDRRDVEISLSDGSGQFKSAKVEYLVAPQIDSKLGITFNGEGVGSDGRVRTGIGQSLRVHRGEVSIAVRGYSAALIRLS